MRTRFGVVVDGVAPAKKQIIASRSFGQPVLTIDELAESVASDITRAVEKLRRPESVCEAIPVFVQTNPFKASDPHYSSGTVRPGTDIPSWLYLQENGRDPAGRFPCVQQQLLFTTFGDGAKSAAMMRTLDGLNQRFGKGAVRVAAAGIRNDWAMTRERKTPNYTTCWSEIPVARAN
ncbi:DUF4113 domain-containing protein [Actimicrobium antarcticum]|uniref:DUF4113 domain-containing protein n=1 Tax=Actimicrobium antarcticum TaxID=1051899 RepID=A0ABP7SXV6_9BURK